MCALFIPAYVSTAAKEIQSHHGHSHHPEIVVVNLMEIFQGLDEVKDLMKDFEAKFMKIVEMIRGMEKDGQDRERALAIKAKNLTPEARDKERMEIERLKNEIRIQAQSLEEKQQESQMMLQQKIGDAIKDYCKKMPWKIVIPGAIYADPSLDKTKEVIDGMNKEYAQRKASQKTAKAVEKIRG